MIQKIKNKIITAWDLNNLENSIQQELDYYSKKRVCFTQSINVLRTNRRRNSSFVNVYQTKKGKTMTNTHLVGFRSDYTDDLADRINAETIRKERDGYYLHSIDYLRPITLKSYEFHAVVTYKKQLSKKVQL